MKNFGLGVFFAALILGLILVPRPGAQKTVIDTGTLFAQMIDLSRLTAFPEPAYKTVQFSSYDRRSRVPGEPDWYANSDGFGGEPLPNFEEVLREPGDDGVGKYLMVDVAGPGAVVRLWTAALSGELEVWLDEQDSPIYRGPAEDFFRRPYDGFPEFASLDGELFSRTVYQRDASYAPIPFARRLRMVWTGNIREIHFYQIGLRLYGEGAEVITFSPADLSRYSREIGRVLEALDDPDRRLVPAVEESPVEFDVQVEPGETVECLKLEGTKAVDSLRLRLDAEDRDRALRQTVLHISCDGFPWGQVQSPVGDFFGAAPGINPYRSLPFTVRPDGTMICRYVMPFKSSLVMRLENFGDTPVRVEGAAHLREHPWVEGRTMHFRARWRMDHDLVGSPTAVQDLPFLLAAGEGVYVGSVSYILNPNEVPTPYGSWWGEGDEKVFIDDDVRPSTFGTGSEDYYNYSWSVPDIFIFPYCGQPRNDGPANRGFVTNYRWHILDALPFRQGIRFFIELKSHERTPQMAYGRIGYHYALPGITDDHLAVTSEDVRPPLLPEFWQPASRMGARNSVFFTAEDVLADRGGTEMRPGRIWAGGALCVWKPESVGEEKDILLRVEEPGKKRLHIVAALTPSSGVLGFEWDGQPLILGENRDHLDLFRPYRRLSRNFTFPVMEMTAGEHVLTLIHRGADDRARGRDIGIDFIWIQSIE